MKSFNQIKKLIIKHTLVKKKNHYAINVTDSEQNVILGKKNIQELKINYAYSDGKKTCPAPKNSPLRVGGGKTGRGGSAPFRSAPNPPREK